jgi:hypothetical protein
MLLAFKENINPIYINISKQQRFRELFISQFALLRIPFSAFNSRRATSKENVQVIFLITSSARAADLPGGGARPLCHWIPRNSACAPSGISKKAPEIFIKICHHHGCYCCWRIIETSRGISRLFERRESENCERNIGEKRATAWGENALLWKEGNALAE